MNKKRRSRRSFGRRICLKDSFYDSYIVAEDLAEKIIRCYKKYNVFFHIRKKDIHILKNSIRFKIKLRSGTRIAEIMKYEKDVQICLKLHLFQVVQDDLNIFISVCSICYSQLSK